VAIAIGALLLAGAVAGLAVALTRGPAAVVVASNSVAVVDPKNGKVVADVPIGGRPVAIATGAGGVWVANADDQTIVRIDPKSRKVVKVIGGLGTNVSDVAVGFGSVWVAGGNDGTLLRIDPSVNATGAPVDLGNADTRFSRGVFLVATGAGNVWVTEGNRVLRIDPSTGEVEKAIAASRPQGLAVGAGSVWVTQLSEHVLRIDPTTGKRTADKNLSSEAFYPFVYRGSLWLVAYSYSDVSQVLHLDPGTLAQTQAAIPFTNGLFPFGLAGGFGALWTVTPSDGGLWRIDPTTDGAATRVAHIGHHPIAVAAGEGALWVGVQEAPAS
jgi:streptogramin lyase